MALPSPHSPIVFNTGHPITARNEDDLRRAVTLLLHLVLFHRALGSVRHSSICFSRRGGSNGNDGGQDAGRPQPHDSSHTDVVEFPIVAESSVMAVVRSKVGEITDALVRGPPKAQLVVSVGATARQERPTRTTPHSSPASGDRSSIPSKETSPTHTAGHSYGWLGQAFAGGIGAGGPTTPISAAAQQVRPDSQTQRQHGTHPALVRRRPDIGPVSGAAAGRGSGAVAADAKSGIEEAVPFEQWKFDIVLIDEGSLMRARNKAEDQHRHRDNGQQLEAQLVELLGRAIKFVDENRDHIPLILSADTSPFAIHIDVMQ